MPWCPTPGAAAPHQRRKQLSKHPPSQFCSSSAPALDGKWQHQAPSLAMGNSSLQGDFLLLSKKAVGHRAGIQLSWAEEPGYSLGSRVVQLVLSGAVKTRLDPVVSPQPPDHIGQVLR